ncbi:hypothetical protein FQN57_006885 [Myotisia sp. PD_48]|nr:hypothetical protein FQN57_006885 [Myotisia sp. PD_48]
MTHRVFSEPHKDMARPPRPALYIDTEKSSNHDEECCYSTSDCPYDSPATASSRPFLSQPRHRKKARLRPYRISQSIMRYVCFAVLSALLLFIFFLFRVTFTHAFLRPTEQTHIDTSKLKQVPPKWESFPFLTRFYGGIRTIVPRKANTPEYPTEKDAWSDAKTPVRHSKRPKSLPFNPYPDYASEAYTHKYGAKVDCFLDKHGQVSVPEVRNYDGVPDGFPDAVFGSNAVLGIDDNICYDRFGRLGPYGLGYGIRMGGSGAGLEGDRDGIEEIWKAVPPVNFRNISWADAQQKCNFENRHRFAALPPPRADRFRALPIGLPNFEEEKSNPTPDTSRTTRDVKTNTEKLPRTAFIIRTWNTFKYTTESMIYLRSLISELSLLSGGEYVVHFLIQVKDDNLPIWSDDDTYDRVLRDSLPEEFQNMGILWSERQMGLIYGGLQESFMRDLPVHGVYRSSFMPLQYFAHQHPEYDFFWNWEMDIRYTGHWYELFNKMGVWAKEQPRKGLWERSSRFYIPKAHGSWEDFRHLVRVQTEIGTNTVNNLWSPPTRDRPNGQRPTETRGDRPIWGPERPPSKEDVLKLEVDGAPPTTYEKDNYQWGVGEEADLLVTNPLFDPEGTTWLLRDDITGYKKEQGDPPRRTAIITAARLSRKLLHTMHIETGLKRHTMFSEMWPASTCLHHGYKAVYVPHSVYIDRRWPIKYLDSVFNGGRNGATGGARTSVFGDREHNFRGTTWFYSAGHSEHLWRRWLGYRSNNDGGEAFELANEGRMCLPPMLLHPVKHVDMVIDAGRA